MSKEHYARIADLYDMFVTTGADVEFFIDEARRAGGDVLELMAGTGRLTLPLAEAGIPVTCVDFSPEMLRRLREKIDRRGLDAEALEMDVRALDLGRQFAQIIIPFQAFPELTAEADQRQALERIHAHLAPGGTFICTLHNPTVRRASVDGQLHLAGSFEDEDNQLFVWLLQTYNADSRLVDVLEFFEEYDSQGRMLEKRTSSLQFHLLEKAAFERLIAETGFEPVALYGDYTHAPFDEASSPFMIWVLRCASEAG
ncbi:MAG TPA: class I SAM-dependent methyltransferase [Aggregatilinea sp.]|uniref:class I SAM-dependent methyltransferase n=1 Tax=Aggregatilinea sp. TaxID=2806333 RepID=UPI002C5B173A|nr:class I SAM-dependent methyltransferase [Aggregatilinea sp.]HML23298.1 class I SAM-dependent methyltransferase [Aggregatilinea sp.]